MDFHQRLPIVDFLFVYVQCVRHHLYVIQHCAFSEHPRSCRWSHGRCASVRKSHLYIFPKVLVLSCCHLRCGAPTSRFMCHTRCHVVHKVVVCHIADASTRRTFWYLHPLIGIEVFWCLSTCRGCDSNHLQAIPIFSCNEILVSAEIVIDDVIHANQAVALPACGNPMLYNLLSVRYDGFLDVCILGVFVETECANGITARRIARQCACEVSFFFVESPLARIAEVQLARSPCVLWP